jgi:hypothetical protein
MPLNPPINLLNEDEAQIVVEILRASDGLGAADRELRQRFPDWDQARRLAALRQAQNLIFKAWEKTPARKRRAQLVSGRGEEHKEGRPESGT